MRCQADELTEHSAYLQGPGSGAAMSFMVAGAISSIPPMTAVWSPVRREVFIAYLGFGVVGAVLFGAAFALVKAI